MLTSSCHSETNRPAAADGPTPSAVASVAADSTEPKAGHRVRIDTGRFLAGTVPGTFERPPELEPAAALVELGAFEIDVFPFPNDPARPPERAASSEEAALACSQRGGRLCTELEWERACKGPDSTPYSTGASFGCERLAGCRSGYGVYGLGSFAEWTSSHFGAGSELMGKPVLRGGEPDEAQTQRRCSRRGTRPGPAAFRCCYGPPNGLKVTEPSREFVFQKTTLTSERLAELLAAHPRTQALTQAEIVLFREPEAARTVVDRGPGDRKGFDFTVAPLLWSPVVGSRFLAVTGRSGEKTSFVVLYYVLGKDRYELASSFVMHDEPGPIAFAYSSSIEPRFHFSSCWGCPGETGKVLHRKPDRAVVVQP